VSLEANPTAARRSRAERARNALIAGAALFWIVLLGLMLGAALALPDALFLALLLVGVPSLAIAQLPLVEGAVVERLPVYWGSIAMLWLLGGAAWLVGTRAEGHAALGLVALPPGALLAWSAGLTLLSLSTIVVFRVLGAAAGLRDSVLLRRLLPRTAREKRVFVILSLAAGVGEELAYRGYAIGALAPLLGTGGAAAVTSLVFGILHGYQGLLGTLRTTVMGGVLAWGFLASGSLWPVIVTHIVIDVLAGIVLGERLLSPAEPGGDARSDFRSSES
jgi:membrane protease YdiL (CAAX protease family)